MAVCLLASEPSGEEQPALGHISAQSMRGHLSFLASDALEGRATPSRGLDIAAEYIAAQFRRAGLEPAGPNGSYFQTAEFVTVNQRSSDFRMTWKSGASQLQFGADEVRVSAQSALDLTNAPVMKLPAQDFAGKVVFGDAQTFQRPLALAKVREGKPALIILLSRRSKQKNSEPVLVSPDDVPEAPLITLYGPKAAEALERRDSAETVSLHVGVPERKPTPVRNVAALLRGSDPQLKDQFIILSAHYDHLGMKPDGLGDRIFNGANDNGSGTVSVIEIASALATMGVHPRRSILFLTFFGEEEGLYGAVYYTRHPLVPLAKTIANINLEQMGRTDERDGREVNAFAFTGPSYSNLPEVMADAAEQEHIRVYQKRDADSFFSRSDNYPFAQVGVVDHTIVVAFEYPDYHGVADEWEKIDYDNMARVDRGVAAGLIRIANETSPPRWKAVEGTEQYRRKAAVP